MRETRHHKACAALFRRFRGPIIAPAPIVTKVATSSGGTDVTVGPPGTAAHRSRPGTGPLNAHAGGPQRDDRPHVHHGIRALAAHPDWKVLSLHRAGLAGRAGPSGRRGTVPASGRVILAAFARADRGQA